MDHGTHCTTSIGFSATMTSVIPFFWKTQVNCLILPLRGLKESSTMVTQRCRSTPVHWGSSSFTLWLLLSYSIKTDVCDWNKLKEFLTKQSKSISNKNPDNHSNHVKFNFCFALCNYLNVTVPPLTTRGGAFHLNPPLLPRPPSLCSPSALHA